MGGIGSGLNRHKTDELKRRLGTFQPCKANNQEKSKEVQKTVKASEPKLPKGLSYEARKLWKTVTGGWVLDYAGLFALERCCKILMRLKEATARLDEVGTAIINPKTGLEAAHPCVKIEKDCSELLLKWWKSLGLQVDIKELL